MGKVLDETGLKHLIQRNDERYVRQEEGKGLSSNDFSDEYKQKIDDLVYEKIAFTSAQATNSSNEIGATVAATKVTWQLNKEPKTLKIKFGSEPEEILDNSERSRDYSGKQIKSNTNIVITATDERNATATRTVTISFQPKVYWGKSIKTTLENADVLALEGQALATSRGRTINVNAGAGEYIYYVIPSSFGTPTFNVGGFDGGFSKVQTFNLTNASGYEQSYDVWKSVNPGLGNSTVKIS